MNKCNLFVFLQLYLTKLNECNLKSLIMFSHEIHEKNISRKESKAKLLFT